MDATADYLSTLTPPEAVAPYYNSFVESLRQPSVGEAAHHILWYTVAFCVGHVVCAVLCGLLFKEYSVETYTDKKTKETKTRPRSFASKIAWDMNLTSLVASTLTFLWYAQTFIDFHLNGDVNTRWTATSWYSTHAICIHIGACFYEMICYVLSGKALVFYLHHVVVIPNCASMLLSGRGHLICAWLGLVEGTNIPLCTLMFLREVARESTLYVISGVSLWLFYVVLRVVSAPVCMWIIYSDTTNHPDVAWLSKDPTLQTTWLWFVFTSAAFLLGLSMLWFKQITAGLIKAISPKKGDKQA